MNDNPMVTLPTAPVVARTLPLAPAAPILPVTPPSHRCCQWLLLRPYCTPCLMLLSRRLPLVTRASCGSIGLTCAELMAESSSMNFCCTCSSKADRIFI